MNKDSSILNSDPRAVLDSLNDGLYVADRDRRIVYWGQSAEKITGWQADDVLGKRCSDQVLCHVDKDGHQLCGEEHCPLYRAMVTGKGSTTPVIVFARGKDGHRIPMQISVAPVRDSAGEVIGGVETFRDLSGKFSDLRRVKKIQSLALRNDVPADGRVRISTHYVPCDIIGGDYYAIAQLDADRYGFLLADVTGHGVAAALYTMYLSSLWEANRALVSTPSAFAAAVNTSLCDLVKEEESFAVALCGVLDLERGELRMAGAGNPGPVLIRNGIEYECLDCSGLPLGLMEGSAYDETAVAVRDGDCLLMFTDGAVEISLPGGGYLDSDGLVAVLKDLGYPNSNVTLAAIEEELLRRSDRIRFDDDLTLLEIRIPSG